jgi:head-tail adaptor
MAQPGKYRYRITIQSRNNTTDVWSTYTSAFAAITTNNADAVIAEDGSLQTTRQYTVRMRYQSTKTLTTRMRIAWTVHGATRYLYISGIEEDADTMNAETVLTCDEVER